MKQKVSHLVASVLLYRFTITDLSSLQEKLVTYEENPENFFPPDFFLKSNANVTLAANTIKDLYLKDVPEDEKMGHMVRVSVKNTNNSISYNFQL